MHLLDLPMDILVLLPNYLFDIEDFKNLSSSCQTLRQVLAGTAPNTILQLAAASSRTFFRPDPHFLVAASIETIRDWALLNASNTEALRIAFLEGIDSLFELCIHRGGLTMAKIRVLHDMRFSTLNPVADLIDRSAGTQWYQIENFWDGGVSNPATIYCDAQSTMYQIIIYGELFGSTFEALLEPERNLPRFESTMRFEYIQHCIPDFLRVPWTVAKGPYVIKRDPTTEDKVAMRHVLRCRNWREQWDKVRHEIGEDFTVEWKQSMWNSALQFQGLYGLEMIRPGGIDKWRQKITEIRDRIERLSAPPKTYTFGTQGAQGHDYPFLLEELYMWMYRR